MTDSDDDTPKPEAARPEAANRAALNQGLPGQEARPDQGQKRRSPIPIRWHHTGFDLTVANVLGFDFQRFARPCFGLVEQRYEHGPAIAYRFRR